MAQNDRRNRLIVDYYINNRAKYGKTIIFACNIDHLNKLATLFKKAGVLARPIHCEQYDTCNKEYLNMLHGGRIDVAINVAKLTHGIGVPDVMTVCLCRPTNE